MKPTAPHRLQEAEKKLCCFYTGPSPHTGCATKLTNSIDDKGKPWCWPTTPTRNVFDFPLRIQLSLYLKSAQTFWTTLKKVIAFFSVPLHLQLSPTEAINSSVMASVRLITTFKKRNSWLQGARERGREKEIMPTAPLGLLPISLRFLANGWLQGPNVHRIQEGWECSSAERRLWVSEPKEPQPITRKSLPKVNCLNYETLYIVHVASNLHKHEYVNCNTLTDHAHFFWLKW